MRAIQKILPALLIVSACSAGMYFWFDHYKTPTVRIQVEAPLFTVGGADYAAALRQGKQVVEWGPLPGSAFYAGSLAFSTPQEAQEWLAESGKAQQGWRVYELTGDFQLDTHMVRGLPHTNKTLLVSREVQAQP